MLPVANLTSQKRHSLLMKKMNCFMGLCDRIMPNLYPSAQLSAHNPASSMARAETKTLELVLKESTLTISADEVVLVSADRRCHRVVMQDGS